MPWILRVLLRQLEAWLLGFIRRSGIPQLLEVGGAALFENSSPYTTALVAFTAFETLESESSTCIVPPVNSNKDDVPDEYSYTGVVWTALL